MSSISVFSDTPSLTPIDRREILRYMGCITPDREILQLLEDCIAESASLFSPRVCWCELPLAVGDTQLCFGSIQTDSASLGKCLDGCERVLLFAATVGLEIDRMIAKYSRISPSKALCLQALGSERAEALCDVFSEQMQAQYRAQNCTVTPRFSPGYGDLPLDLQRNIFAVLDCPRRIGLSLKESLVMTPAKSVTAIIGIKKENV